MKKAILSRDVTVNFRGTFDVHAKAGTPLEYIAHNAGLAVDSWAIPPSACTHDVGIYADFDLAHYYVWAPADAVEVLP